MKNEMYEGNCAEMNVFNVAVLTVSDRCSRGETQDESGQVIKHIIGSIGGETAQYDIVADEIDHITEKLVYYCDTLKVDIVLTTGGTGLGPRDSTPEATGKVSERMIPGISELMRSEGAKHTHNAMLSRGISVIRGDTIIINLPGSPKGVRESLRAILGVVPHALEMIKGKKHLSIDVNSVDS